MTGPNPNIIPGPLRPADDTVLPRLTSLTRLSPEVRDVLEDRVSRIWRDYLSALAAMRASPREQEIRLAIERRHREIGQAIVLLGGDLPILERDTSRPPSLVAQFHAVLGDLLRQNGSSLDDLRLSAEMALKALRAFDQEHATLLAAMEEGLKDGLFTRVSERALRQKLFVALHGAIVDAGCDSSTGSNSLIVLIVMDLELPSQLGTVTEDSYRKGLARQITKAVKAQTEHE